MPPDNNSYLVLNRPAQEDVTDRLESLMTQAKTEGKSIWVGTKDMVISRSVEITTNMHGPGAKMAGFISRVEDASPTLYCPAGEFLSLRGFNISGHNDLQNTVGLRLGDPAITEPLGNSVFRSAMQDVLITKCSIGLEWQGWINTLSNVLVTWCGLGANLTRQNSCDLGLMFEANHQDFQMKNCWGSTWPVLLMEGNRDLHQAASTMDNVRALTIGTLYTEHAGTGVETAPWLHIGPRYPCSNIKISSAIFGENEVESLVVDIAEGVTASIWNRGGSAASSYRVTSQASAVDIQEFRNV